MILAPDRGSSIVLKSVAELLMDLTVIESHSRPHARDANPFPRISSKH